MIFCQDCVSCDDFGDCHDEITISCVDFIGRWPIYDLYLQGEKCFWEPPTTIATLSHRSHRRWSRREIQSRSRGDKSASYVVPDDATADILLAI
jgi:hypothetical protein